MASAPGIGLPMADWGRTAPKTFSDQDWVYGLTLWQPWAWLVAAGHKPVENRPWAPPLALYGRFFCIHAGAKFDKAGQDMAASFGVETPGAGHVAGAIIGVARLVGLADGPTGAPRLSYKYGLPTTRTQEEALAYEFLVRRWYFGTFGWLLADVQALAEPVPVRGFQKLWRVPDDVLGRVRQSIEVRS